MCFVGLKQCLGAARLLNSPIPLTGLRVSGLHGAQIRDTERSMCLMLGLRESLRLLGFYACFLMHIGLLPISLPLLPFPLFPFFYYFGLNLGRGEVSYRDLDLGRQDFLPWLSAWGDADQFPILCSAGHWAMVCVDQEIPSCFVPHNAFISATEPKLLFCFSFFFDETVRTLFL